MKNSVQRVLQWHSDTHNLYNDWASWNLKLHSPCYPVLCHPYSHMWNTKFQNFKAQTRSQSIKSFKLVMQNIDTGYKFTNILKKCHLYTEVINLAHQIKRWKSENTVLPNNTQVILSGYVITGLITVMSRHKTYSPAKPGIYLLL